jgi:secreted PhoX family phosphatase
VIYDAPNANDLDNPDNITVTPRGGLLLCEDAAGNHFLEGERLVGLTLDGKTFTFAMNNVNLTAEQIASAGKTVAPGNFTQTEWAGLLQPRRQVALREHPDARDHVRDYGAVGEGAALERG